MQIDIGKKTYNFANHLVVVFTALIMKEKRSLFLLVSLFTFLSFWAQTCAFEAKPKWLNNKLAAHYTFDGSLSDSSENMHDPLGNSQILFSEDRFGQRGVAASFKEERSYLQLDNRLKHFLPTETQDTTISFWAHSSATGYILSQYPLMGASSANMFIRLDSNDNEILLTITGNGTNTLLGSWRREEISSLKGWIHFTVVYKNESLGCKVYLNGQIGSRGNLNLNDTVSKTRIFIGKLSDSNNQSLKGQLDDLRIYGRALDDKEVSELFEYELTMNKPAVVEQVIVMNGFVVAAPISFEGRGYRRPPNVFFIGGNPDEVAQAEAVWNNRRIKGINITSAGSGYKEPPYIVISSPPLESELAISVSKIETVIKTKRAAIAEPEIFEGFLIGAKIIDGGLGYDDVPNITISDVSGSGASALAIVENGAVIGVKFSKAGTGYTDETRISISSPKNPDKTPKVVEVEIRLKLDHPNNYYVLERTDDMVNWQQIGKPFFVYTKIHTLKVGVQDSRGIFRVKQLP